MATGKHHIIRDVAGRIRSGRRLTVTEWNEANVDYRRVPSYDTQLKARYSGDYMPWWRELADAMLDRSVRELWVLKNSRAGCTENTILAPMRYAVANGGKQMLYVSHVNYSNQFHAYIHSCTPLITVQYSDSKNQTSTQGPRTQYAH